MTALRMTPSCGPSNFGTPTRFLSADADPDQPNPSTSAARTPRTIRTRNDDAALLIGSEAPGSVVVLGASYMLASIVAHCWKHTMSAAFTFAPREGICNPSGEQTGPISFWSSRPAPVG